MATSISLDQIEGDNFVNAVEAQGPLVVSGTATGAENSVVTENVYVGTSATGPSLFTNFAQVSNGVFSSAIPSFVTSNIPDGVYTVTADVTGTDGSAAPEAQQVVTVDTMPPAYSTLGLTFTNQSGTEGVGDTVSFAIGPDSPVIVTGIPTLQLSNGEVATYDPTTSTATSLNFVYTVKASDNSTTDLQIVAAPGQTTGLLLNGGSITDAAGNPFTGDIVGDTFLAVDTTPVVPPAAPVLTLAPVAGDNVVDATEHQNALTLSGTATGADGQHVTASLYLGPAATGTPVFVTNSAVVTNGSFSGTIPAAIVSQVPDGVYTLAVDVVGTDGVPAQEVTETVTVNTTGTPVGPPLPDTTPPSIVFDSSVGLAASGDPANPTTATFTGTASDNVGVTSVTLLEGSAVLGTTPVNADGTWSISVNLAPGSHAGFQAVATDPSGNTASASSSFDLNTGMSSGIPGQPYTSFEDRYAADGSFQGQTFFKDNGAVLFSSTYTALPDGGSSYTYSGGTFFHGKSYSSFTDIYDANGTLVEDIQNNRDGSHTIEADASGQQVASIGTDLFANDAPNTQFVFSKGFGHDTITDFTVGGPNHDTLVLPPTDIGHLAQIIASAHTVNGDTTFNINTHDSITLVGITTGQLKAHPKDITFHA